MIDLHVCNNKVFVWNPKDVCTLRNEHRIVGSLVGYYPIKPFQVETKWLPLQLMDEEAGLLIEKGIARAVDFQNKLSDTNQVKLFYEKRDNLCEEQIVLLKENRKKEILEKANKIYEGKKRKLLEGQAKKKAKKCLGETSQSDVAMLTEVKDIQVLDIKKDSENISNEKAASELKGPDIDKDAIIEAELKKVSEVKKDLCLVQLFTESPFEKNQTVVNWKVFPSSAEALVRYKVFKDLWERKYYITSGSKFGGDFLVYEGDPFKYHALFTVVCKTRENKFQGSDIVIYGRLGHQVKKTCVFASVNATGTVEYISISWEHKMT